MRRGGYEHRACVFLHYFLVEGKKGEGKTKLKAKEIRRHYRDQQQHGQDGAAERDGVRSAEAAAEGGRHGEVSAAGLPLLPGVQLLPHPERRQRPLQHDRAPESQGLRVSGPDPVRGRGGEVQTDLGPLFGRHPLRRAHSGRGFSQRGQHDRAGV